jgi:hypothetical protein
MLGPSCSDLSPFGGFSLDYQTILVAISGTLEDKIALLAEELPHLWRDAYVRTSNRSTSVVRILDGFFEYLYDNYSYLEVTHMAPSI